MKAATRWNEDLVKLVKEKYPLLGGKTYDSFSEFKEAGISFEAFCKKAERLRVRYKPDFTLKKELPIAGEINKVIHLKTDEDKVRIIPVGDIHVGAPENLCDWKKVIGVLKYIETTPNTYMIGMGDYGDFATKMSHGPSVYDSTLTPQQQYATILNAFKPVAVKNKILGMLSGNHDDWIGDATGINVVRNLARELNTTHFSSGATIYIYVNDKRYVFNIRHGVGRAKEPHTKMQSLYSQTRNLFADVYLMGHCLSEDTEILTKEGWKKHEDVYLTDEIMTLNTKTEKLEWNGIEDIWKYKHYKEHINFKTDTVDLSVTPDHKMIYSWGNRSTNPKINIASAKQLAGFSAPFDILQSGNFDYKGISLSDDKLRLLGWIISEGSFCRGRKGKPYAFRLFQNWENRHRITDLLDKLNYEYNITKKKMKGREFSIDNKTYKTNDDCAVIYLPSKYAKEYFDYIKEKDVSQFLMDMTKQQFIVFLEALVNGDGWKDSFRVWNVSTGNINLANHLQIMGITRGIRTVIDKDKRGYSVRFSLEKSRQQVSPKKRIKTVPYNGISWCVSVPNGTIIVRRNNKTAIVGNTHTLAVSKSAYVLEGILHKTYRVLTGSFLQWNQSYAMEFGMVPEPTGVAKVSLFDRVKDTTKVDIHISV